MNTAVVTISDDDAPEGGSAGSGGGSGGGGRSDLFSLLALLLVGIARKRRARVSDTRTRVARKLRYPI
jgi:hypothetical protein